MKARYQKHNLEITCHVQPKYWTFYLNVKIDENEVIGSKIYELPRSLKVYRWCIEELPVHIITDDMPYIGVYWEVESGEMNARQIVNIRNVFDYIMIHMDKEATKDEDGD